MPNISVEEQKEKLEIENSIRDQIQIDNKKIKDIERVKITLDSSSKN
jgi:hypothetical protein